MVVLMKYEKLLFPVHGLEYCPDPPEVDFGILSDHREGDRLLEAQTVTYTCPGGLVRLSTGRPDLTITCQQVGGTLQWVPQLGQVVATFMECVGGEMEI